MNNRLYIIWTTDSPDTAHQMVFMYAINSLLRHFWEDVTVVIWGASARLVLEDQSIQDKIKAAMDTGVKVSACVACAAQFGAVDKLNEMGIETISWGPILTDLLKNREMILTI